MSKFLCRWKHIPNVDVEMGEEMLSEGWSAGALGFFSSTEACSFGLYEPLYLFYRVILVIPPTQLELWELRNSSIDA